MSTDSATDSNDQQRQRERAAGVPARERRAGGATMREETWDRVLGDIFAAMDRDAAAEGQLIRLIAA